MYKCSKCTSTFAHRCYLSYHDDSVHKGIRFPCTMCSSILKYRSNLTRHMKNIHGMVRVSGFYSVDEVYEMENEYTLRAVVSRRQRRPIQTSSNEKTSEHRPLIHQQSHDTRDNGGTMSSDNGQSVTSPRPPIAGNAKPKIEHLDSGVQRKLMNNLDDILMQQARPTGQDEYVRPSVIVWNPAAIRRQTTFAQSLQDAGSANRNTGTCFRPV